MKLRMGLILFSFISFLWACEGGSSSKGDGEETGTDAEKSTVVLGSAGESCTSRRDCQEGLACYAQVCTKDKADEDDTDSSDVENADPRGGEGESCTARKDCQEGLGCYGNVCLENPVMDAGPELGLISPSTRSEMGESCRARNDCVEGLTCVNSTCVDNNVAIQITAKSCVYVECAKDDDCCADYEPQILQTQCDNYKDRCDSDPETYEYYCTTYASQCECHRKCVDSRCDTPLLINCTQDSHCADQILELYCVENHCVECKNNDHCTIEGYECIDNVCQEPPPPCTNNEQCPLMSACQNGDCVEVGCTSDRECFFYTSFDRSICNPDKKCTIPCETNDDCFDPETDTLGVKGRSRDPFWVCEEEGCVFVGCKTDEECRIYLGVENQLSSGAKAKCQ